ncbi:hypothetical protein, partial [Telmatospirillum siberiense]|uniref:hypothetical protein n=1 Tax=Telmatospirillum siberiense TaxID=382514 RepID=UPI0011AFA189
MAPRYEASLENYLAKNSADSTVASDLSNTRVLLFGEWYNGGSNVVGNTQLTALRTDNFNTLVVDLLTANTKADGQHQTGLENRAIQALYAYLGLPIPTDLPGSGNVSYSPITVDDPQTAAALLGALITGAGTIQQNLATIRTDNPLLAAGIQNLINDTKTGLDSLLGAASLGVIRAGETIDQFAARVGADPAVVRALNPQYQSGSPSAGQELVFASAAQPIGDSSYDVNGAYATAFAFLINLQDHTISRVGADPGNSNYLPGNVYVMDGAKNIVGVYAAGTISSLSTEDMTGAVNIGLGAARGIDYQSDGTAIVTQGTSQQTFQAGTFIGVSQQGATVFSIGGAGQNLWQDGGTSSPISFYESYGGYSSYLTYAVSKFGLSGDQIVAVNSYETTDGQGVTSRFETAQLQDASGNVTTVTLEMPLTGGSEGSVTVAKEFGGESLLQTSLVNADGTLGTIANSFTFDEGVSTTTADAGNILSAINTIAPTDAPVSVPTFSKTALGVTVTDLATAAQTAAGSGGDG